jgi:hypothetical protein
MLKASIGILYKILNSASTTDAAIVIPYAIFDNVSVDVDAADPNKYTVNTEEP